ncbi:MAG: DNA polymerase IV [Anaerolineaceae bacterium]
MRPRKILHLDLDAFFASVEELLDPSLIGVAFAVGGSSTGRGVITSPSYAARAYGVRSAMPAGKALSLCPGLRLVRGSYHRYSDYSDKVMSILQDVSPLVEQVSVDEAFVDVSDLPQPIKDICVELQTRVFRETGLPCSIGAATNKLVAKVANDYGKTSVKTGKAPRKITIVALGWEAEFLAPLDIQALWGIGPKTAEHLRARGFSTIGQIANLTDEELKLYFGTHGESMRDHARGIDNSTVHTYGELKSVSNEITFHEDSAELDFLLNKLRYLSDKVGYRLRKKNLAGSVVSIKLRYSDFTTLTRQQSLKNLTDLDDEIFACAKKLLIDNLTSGREVRLIGVGVSNLNEPTRQLSMFEPDLDRKEDLAAAIDKLKDRYGKDVIKRASSLNTKNSFRDD